MASDTKTTIPRKGIAWRVALTLFILAWLAGPGATYFQILLTK